MNIPQYDDPLQVFNEWYEEAKQHAEISEPGAMSLATTDEAGIVSPRIVLLRGLGPEGFTFYTNLDSDKGRQLRATPRAGLNFYWMPLGTQVRVLGSVTQTSDETADAYFASRPRESQIGAWASKQSETLESQGDLLDRVREYTEEFMDQDVPRPPFWSGFTVAPESIEFWLKQPFRLHDRLLYTREADGGWSQRALYP